MTSPLFISTVTNIMYMSLSEMTLFKAAIKISVSLNTRNWVRDFTSSRWNVNRRFVYSVSVGEKGYPAPILGRDLRKASFSARYRLKPNKHDLNITID